MQLFSPCLYVDTLQKNVREKLYLFTHLYSFAQESQQNPSYALCSLRAPPKLWQKLSEGLFGYIVAY